MQFGLSQQRSTAQIVEPESGVSYKARAGGPPARLSHLVSCQLVGPTHMRPTASPVAVSVTVNSRRQAGRASASYLQKSGS